MRPEYYDGEPAESYDGKGNREFDSEYAKVNRRLGRMYLKMRENKKEAK